MRRKVDVLGVHFDAVTMEEAIAKATAYMEEEGGRARMIFTANPEIVMLAEHNSRFMQIINEGDLVVADGIGVVIGAKWLGHPLPERVAGFDLVQGIFEKMKSSHKTAYFFGAAPGIAEAAAKRMMAVHKGLKVLGSHDGYFDEVEEYKIVEEIKRLKPDLLLVGLGAPKQENWIKKHKDELGVKLCIGVGGSFDVMSGSLKRAPELFIRFGLEWFHRLITQPTRFKRMMKLPLFLVHVVRKNISGR